MSAQLTLRVPQAEIPCAPPAGAILVLALATVAALILADTRPVARAPLKVPAVQVTATFTGWYENGLPVYRLPTVEVAATRQQSAAIANAAGPAPRGQPRQ